MSDLRDSLARSLHAAAELEAELVALCDDSPPRTPGSWTPKDHLAHLAAWREHAADVLDEMRAGRTPASGNGVGARNARIYAENRDVPAAEVRARAGASYGRLLAAIAACSDDVLLAPRGSFGRVWELVPGNGIYHVGEHLLFWHMERGDPTAAEHAARRAYEIDVALFDDPAHRGSTTYNLGCLYVRVGRTDEAVALLEQSFEYVPDLRRWAQEDADLESIRDRL